MFVVDSNDSLYAGDPKFVKKVAVLVNTLISQILDHLKTLAHPEEVSQSQQFIYTRAQRVPLFLKDSELYISNP